MADNFRVHTHHEQRSEYPSTVKRAARQFAACIAAPCGTVDLDDVGDITVETNEDGEFRLTVRRMK